MRSLENQQNQKEQFSKSGRESVFREFNQI